MPENRGSSYKGYTEARARANAKYISQFVEIKVRTAPEQRDRIKAHADSCGESVNGFISRAISETMERDNNGNPQESLCRGLEGPEAVSLPEAAQRDAEAAEDELPQPGNNGERKERSA